MGRLRWKTVLQSRYSTGMNLILFALLTAACQEQAQLSARQQIPAADAQRGRQVFQDYGCGDCHIIPGVEFASGVVAPSLAEWSNRRYLAGNFLNTPLNLIGWIENPQAYEPATTMPNLGVSDQDARDMSAYLFTLERRRGISGWLNQVRLFQRRGGTESNSDQENQGQAEENQLRPSGFVSPYGPGAEYYLRYCAECHQPDGSGLRGSVPGLAGNPLVVASNPGDLLDVVLQTHSHLADFQDRLSDQEFAEAISFIRSAWDNHASAVSAEQVSSAR